jgi:hypothetical protein
MKHSSPLLLFVMVAAACDQPLFSVEAEVKEVCLSGVRLEFPAAPAATLDQLELDRVADGAPLTLPEGSRATARLTGVGVALTEGPEDFAFLDTLRLEMTGADPDGDLPSVALIDVAEVEHLPVLFFESDGQTDLIEYLGQETLAFEVGLRGELPAEPWTVELDLCFRLEVAYSY